MTRCRMSAGCAVRDGVAERERVMVIVLEGVGAAVAVLVTDGMRGAKRVQGKATPERAEDGISVCPDQFLPQQVTLPTADREQTWSAPDARAT